MREYLKELWQAAKESVIEAPRMAILALTVYALFNIVMQYANFVAVYRCLEWRVPQAAIGPGLEIYCIVQIHGTTYARPISHMNHEWQAYGGE